MNLYRNDADTRQETMELAIQRRPRQLEPESSESPKLSGRASGPVASSRRWRFLVAPCLTFATWFSLSMPLYASANPDSTYLTILMVSSYSKDIPAQVAFETGLDNAMGFKGGEHNVFFEFMDVSRLKGRSVDTFATYIEKKYQSLTFQFVIGWGTPAINCLTANNRLFADSQHIYIEVGDHFQTTAASSDNTTMIGLSVDYRKSIDEVLRLMDAEHIIVIGTTTDNAARKRLSLFQQILTERSSRANIELMVDQPLQQVISALQNASREKSIAFYLLMFSDGRGVRMSPYRIASLLAAQSSVPVFSYWESLMGSGIVGGYVLSFEEVGFKIGTQMLAVEDGQPVESFSPMRYVYDWNALKKWRIQEKSLPDEKIIVNAPKSILATYKWQIASISIGLAVATSIVFLVYRNNLIRKTNEELARLSATDPLTGLLNRRAIRPIIEREMSRNMRFNQPVSLLIVDLDNFKQVNDKFGHAAGDEVLSGVARALRKRIRLMDDIARWGGDEFLVLAPNTDRAHAVVLAEGLRKSIMSLQFEGIDSVTATIGVAEYRSAQDFNGWYERADIALYKAKQSGDDIVTD